MDFVLLVALVASWLVIAAICFVLYQLMVQNGRMLLRVEALERWSAPWPEAWQAEESGVEEYLGSLPIGVPAPLISLPDLNGAPRVLSEWRGKRVLLVFFDPDSVFCRRLLPWLAALASDVVPDRPVPLVVTTGDLERNRRLFDESGFTGVVLVQAAMEVAAAYKVDGTPMSYLIEPDGMIGSEVAVGVQATLILAGEMATLADATASSPDAGATADQHLGDGLPVGSGAPIFRLPSLDGEELSLLEFRGGKVVVVFSDPECEPCDRLAPLLEAAHRAAPDLALVMISRGEIEANRAKVAQFDISFPVVLQRHWEISRQYGMLATPIAYLIDEWGAIASDVAAGPDAILALVTRAIEKGDTAATSAYDDAVRPT